jgi:hypothetical protein
LYIATTAGAQYIIKLQAEANMCTVMGKCLVIHAYIDEEAIVLSLPLLHTTAGAQYVIIGIYCRPIVHDEANECAVTA